MLNLTIKKPLESEKNTERYLKEQIESLGGKCWKWVSPNTRGVPDRICFLPGGHIFFVEVKSEGKDLEPHQKRRAKDLIRLGQRCYRVDTKSAVDELLKGELHDFPSSESPESVSNERGVTQGEIPTSWLP